MHWVQYWIVILGLWTWAVVVVVVVVVVVGGGLGILFLLAFFCLLSSVVEGERVSGGYGLMR